MTLSFIIWTLLALQAIIMASEDPKVSKQCAFGKRQHIFSPVNQMLLERGLGK